MAGFFPEGVPEAAPGSLDGAKLDRLECAIAELSAHIAAATCLLLERIAVYDRERGWTRHGLASCAHWLQWKCGTNLGAAREKVRVARALPELPLIREAFRRGTVSYSKVRAMTRVATPANEAFLLRIARHGTARHVERTVRNYRRHQRLELLRQEQRSYAARELNWSVEADGCWVLRGRFCPEQGALIQAALEKAMDRLSEERAREAPEVSVETPRGGLDGHELPRPVPARRADALERIAEAFLAGGCGAGQGGDLHMVHLHTSSEVLRIDGAGAGSECEGCGDVSAETSRRLACDASVVRWTQSGAGETLSVGRRTRSVPPSIGRALRRRDGGCRFPGCSCCRFVDAHHIVHWADGGETALSNLVLLCRRHHRLVHEGGFGVRTGPGGELQFSYPTGAPLPAAADGRFRGNVERLRSGNRGRGLEIGPATLPSLWRGEVMDYDVAQLTMQRLE